MSFVAEKWNSYIILMFNKILPKEIIKYIGVMINEENNGLCCNKKSLKKWLKRPKIYTWKDLIYSKDVVETIFLQLKL